MSAHEQPLGDQSPSGSEQLMHPVSLASVMISPFTSPWSSTPYFQPLSLAPAASVVAQTAPMAKADTADPLENSADKPASPLSSQNSASRLDDYNMGKDERHRLQKELEEAQQKALERMISFSGFRSSGFVPTPPFLASLQAPLSINGQLLDTNSGATNAASPSPEEQDDAASRTSGEPEDLSVKSASVVKCKSDEGVPGTPPSGDSESQPQQNWSYEEQFKQLYELSEEPKRKEWLDDWLNFMHKIGKPVTRIPIMAKQVLDLYELYRLVVQHGGLVEIINKKLWREITKGLNLPSSITSAAFTLRTQYQKYLYDYECEKEGLSSPSELQQAIDGNRREGRRQNPSFAPYPLAPSLLSAKHVNGTPLLRDDEQGVGMGSAHAQQAALAAAYREQQHLAALEAQRQLERAQRAAVEALQKQQQAQQQASGRTSTSSVDSDSSPHSARKRARIEKEEPSCGTAAGLERLFSGMSSAHIKMTSRGDGRFGSDNSLVVSMEINGTMYQGVLFALPSAGAPMRPHPGLSP